jgi:hypothetical protein
MSALIAALKRSLESATEPALREQLKRTIDALRKRRRRRGEAPAGRRGEGRRRQRRECGRRSRRVVDRIADKIAGRYGD